MFDDDDIELAYVVKSSCVHPLMDTGASGDPTGAALSLLANATESSSNGRGSPNMLGVRSDRGTQGQPYEFKKDTSTSSFSSSSSSSFSSSSLFGRGALCGFDLDIMSKSVIPCNGDPFLVGQLPPLKAFKQTKPLRQRYKVLLGYGDVEELSKEFHYFVYQKRGTKYSDAKGVIGHESGSEDGRNDEDSVALAEEKVEQKSSEKKKQKSSSREELNTEYAYAKVLNNYKLFSRTIMIRLPYSLTTYLMRLSYSLNTYLRIHTPSILTVRNYCFILCAGENCRLGQCLLDVQTLHRRHTDQTVPVVLGLFPTNTVHITQITNIEHRSRTQYT